MLTVISTMLIISIILFILFFKRKYIYKIRSIFFYLNKNNIKTTKNEFLKENINNQIRYQKDANIYSNLEKYYFKKKMLKLFKGSKAEKLEALNIAKKLSDKSTLNILKIGLKDMDSDIVKLSAKLIEKFK